MKRLALILSFSSVFFLLVACGNSSEEDSSFEETPEVEDEDTNEEENSSDQGASTDEDSLPSNEDMDNEDVDSSEESAEADPLADYSEQEIEYARVWLEVGSTDDPGTLNVNRVSAGTPINTMIDSPPTYNEDVIMLTGEAGAMGIVVYSGNGDGTINHYSKVTYRWENPAGLSDDELRAEYEEILEHTEHVEIDTHNDDDVIRIIEQIEYQD
ncbi:hypothetical protein ACS127_02835 [Amphibacillus sp. Q70]|uniref:hypothetical protein n=1 Tax=Amphibacillus sp. Q70 TaxID=3453416 RepID=UPI003F863DB8